MDPINLCMSTVRVEATGPSAISSKPATKYRRPDLGGTSGSRTLSKTSGIPKLSVEETHLVFKEFNVPAAACVALTCKGLYSIYKTIHPDLIVLKPSLSWDHCWPYLFE